VLSVLNKSISPYTKQIGDWFMGKITISLRDETEKKLRSYLTSKYKEQTFGKLSAIVETSVKEYLEKQKGGISNQVFY
jgi:hypothetical protein